MDQQGPLDRKVNRGFLGCRASKGSKEYRGRQVLTVLQGFLVNRDLDKKRKVSVKLENADIPDGKYKVLFLDDVPKGETFRSHTDNALQQTKVTVKNGEFSMSLPTVSVAAVLLGRD